MKKSLKLLAAVGVLTTAAQSATTFLMTVVGDNDFAVFSGTPTAVNSLLFQNGVVWNSQVASISTITFTLPSGDDTFYILGMGGGGQENLSGLLNGVDITALIVGSVWQVQMSSNLSGSLTGFASSTSQITNGSYNVIIGDVQGALSGLTWGNPTKTIGATVPSSWVHPEKNAGFDFASNTARLFRFSATGVGVIPEPASVLVGGIGLLALLRRRRA